MGEIKSTLDIVMEKTKGLTLSRDEKEKHSINEVKKNLKGLLQKFEDKVLNREQFEEELNILQKSHALKEKNIFISEILGRLDLAKDNRLILALLREAFGLNVSKLESLFNDFQDTIYKDTKKSMDEIKNNLAETHFISGSAVVPNLKMDDEWKSKIRDIQERFMEKLDLERGRLIN